MFVRFSAWIRSHKELVCYIFFGALTTLINYTVFFPLYNILSISATISNIVAWCVSVVFAFFTNKYYVFRSMDRSLHRVASELIRFLGCRFGSGVTESLILFVTVDIMSWNGNIWKLITGVFVIVANYFGTKFLVFQKNS